MALVFISYAHEDSEIAVKVQRVLEAESHDVQIDTKILGGEYSVETVTNQITNCHCFIPILTNSSINSKWVNHEIQLALKASLEGKSSHGTDFPSIIPIWTDSITADQIPDQLGVKNSLSFEEEKASDFKKLLSSVPYLAVNIGGRGRRKMKKIAFGLDVGSTNIKYALIELDESGDEYKTLHSDILDYEVAGETKDYLAFRLVEKLTEIVKRTCDKRKTWLRDIAWIGVGLPGQVDPSNGLIINLPAWGLEEFEFTEGFRRELKKQFKDELEEKKSVDGEKQIPEIIIDNDVKCAARAEVYFGVGKGQGGVKEFVVILIGTGIGAAIVSKKQIFYGSNFSAGEIGHMTIDLRDDAERCNCGSRGCFENYFADRGIKATARRHIEKATKLKSETILKDLDPIKITPKDIGEFLGKTSDIGCVELRNELARHLGIALANVANVLAPQEIVLGGGIIRGFYESAAFYNQVTKYFREYALDVCRNIRPKQTTLDEVPWLGAACLGFRD